MYILDDLTVARTYERRLVDLEINSDSLSDALDVEPQGKGYRKKILTKKNVPDETGMS